MFYLLRIFPLELTLLSKSVRACMPPNGLIKAAAASQKGNRCHTRQSEHDT